MNRDFTTGFGIHPDTGELLVRTGTGAITQAISNLILTDEYDRPYQPKIGGSIRKRLFELVTDATAGEIASLVREQIRNYEPRAQLTNVVVQAVPDQERYVVNISYIVDGNEQPVNQQITLSRVR